MALIDEITKIDLELLIISENEELLNCKEYQYKIPELKKQESRLDIFQKIKILAYSDISISEILANEYDEYIGSNKDYAKIYILKEIKMLQHITKENNNTNYEQMKRAIKILRDKACLDKMI
jgi:hypothetical protein